MSHANPTPPPQDSWFKRAILDFLFPREVAVDRQRRNQREDAEFMPDTLGAFFQRPPALPFLIVRTTLVFLVCAILWAAFAEIDEITVGEGKVIPSSQMQVIQNLEGGIVAQIPVRVGDMVRKGDVVAVLDDTRFSSSLSETRAKAHSLEAKIARLEAEAAGRDFEPPESVARENPAAVADEQRVFLARKLELDSQLSVLRQQLAQRTQEANEKRARLQQLQDSYALVTKELSISRPMVAQGVLSEIELLRLERQANDINGEANATRLAIPRIESSAAEIRDKIDNTIAKFRSDAAAELASARAEYAGTTASSVAAEDRLARTSIRSPVNGVINQIKVTTVGGVIQPGMDIMDIVPIEDTLLIEARIRPADIGFLHPGQEAMVKISAYDFSIYGGLDAKVENISADSITDEKGESYYQVRVRTQQSYLGSAEKPLQIIPGMLASVHIKTGKKTLLAYLLKPVIKAKYDALRER